jgi:hypothetical protein
LLEWVLPTAKLAPLVGLNAGYAYAKYMNPDETLRKFSGTGPIVSARVGALIERRWLTGVRVDIPLFPLTLAEDEGRTHRALAIVAEFGIRFPSR